MSDRAGRFLGILVIPRYGNKTVRVSIDNTRLILRILSMVYRLNFTETILSLRYYRGFTVYRNSFEARRNSNSYTIEDKSLVLAKPNQ